MRVTKRLTPRACLRPMFLGLISHGLAFAQPAFAQAPASIADGQKPASVKALPAQQNIFQQNKASAEFSQALLAINTMSGHFEQRILDSEGEELQLTRGEFTIKRPGYFFWKVLPPYEQIVIGTPESLKIYDPDLDQLSVHNQNSLAGTPASLMSGDVASISRDYAVTKNDVGGEEVYELRQKDGELSAFEVLTFAFAKKDKGRVLSKMVFVDKLGQRTEVAMSKLATNTPIDPAIFQFTPPAGTDVIVDG